MGRAQQRDAVRSGKFYFRKSVLPPGQTTPTPSTPSSSGSCSPIEWSGNGIPVKEKKLRNCFPPLARPPCVEDGPIEDEYEEMTIDEILNGKGSGFPGLLGLVEAYLDTLDVEAVDKLQINSYLDLVRKRANGTLQTPATWIRNFVRSHPAYKFDSVVSQEINYDLMVAVDQLERGVLRAPEFLPDNYGHPLSNGKANGTAKPQ